MAVLHAALEKGVPLPEDELYYELLSVYPYYQKKLKERQEMVEKVKRRQQMADKERRKLFKYKFEEKLRGKLEVMTDSFEGSPDDHFEAQMAKYNKILEDYNHDIEEMRNLRAQIQQDVITEEDRIKEVRQIEKSDLGKEKRLGKKYLTTITDEEAGSKLASVNMRESMRSMLDQFLGQGKEEDNEI